MSEFYTAVRKSDCEAHYFKSMNHAFIYAFGHLPDRLSCEINADGNLTYVNEEATGWVTICRLEDDDIN